MPQPAPEHRRHVFISYSRADRAWVDRLRITMAPLLREAGEELVLWDDSQIRPGELWQKTIETALARARVALLLVSAEFLASDFVMGREVPVLLEAAEREGVPILWVSLSPCWVSFTPIHAYQAVLPPDTSLEEMTEPQQRRALVRIAEEVHRALLEATEREQVHQRAEAERARQAAERRQAEEESRARRLREEERLARLQREERELEARRAQEEEDNRARRRQEEDPLRRERDLREAEARRERQEREARAAAERLRVQQRKAEAEARVRQQLQDVMERLLTRRKLLLTAAGVPLAAIGLARLAGGPQGSGSPPVAASRPPSGGSLRDQPVATGAPPAGPLATQTLEATHGWLERQKESWRIQTRPIQVRGLLERLAPDLELRLIQIPAGRFRMGSPPQEEGRDSDEGPQHEVALEGFWLGQTAITQTQWRVVAGWPKVEQELEKDPSHFQGDGRPVEGVSWHDAMEFCRRLSQRTGRTYSLPSEAQWEYACRAGTTTPFAFGETISPELANYDATVSYANGPKGVKRGETTPVGSYPANAWGLQDMHGNVWEWCLDHWHDSYAGAPADGSAWVSKAGADAHRLLRGGSWVDDPRFCRSAYRVFYHPDNRNYDWGFRVCCLPQDSASLHLNP